MGLLLDFTIGLGGLFSVLVLLMQFTPFVSMFHVAVIGFSMFLIVFVAAIYVFLPTGGSVGGRDSVFGGDDSPEKFFEVAARINTLLKEDTEWEHVKISPSTLEFDSEDFIHKKTKKIHPHRAFLTELSSSKTPVRIIYDERKDDIRQWKPNPSPEERRDLFANYDPVRLQRVMSERYEEDEDEERDAVEVEFSARSTPPRADPDEDW